jgi:hypothetical protein
VEAGLIETGFYLYGTDTEDTDHPTHHRMKALLTGVSLRDNSTSVAGKRKFGTPVID